MRLTRVSRCCCCFDLKYGFYTYGIVLLIFRVALITTFWSLVAAASYIAYASTQPGGGYVYGAVFAFTTPGIGYMIATTVALFVALKGISQERSILIYPFIVVLIVEMILTILFHVWAMAVITPFFIFSMLIYTAIELYVFICLWSLYKAIVDREGSPLLPVQFSNEHAMIPKP